MRIRLPVVTLAQLLLIVTLVALLFALSTAVVESRRPKPVSVWPGELRFSPEGRWLAAGVNVADGTRVTGELYLWDARSLRRRGSIKTPVGWITSLAFSRDGKMLAVGSMNGWAMVWDCSEGRQVALVHHVGGVVSVALSPDGQALATGTLHAELTNELLVEAPFGLHGDTAKQRSQLILPRSKSTAMPRPNTSTHAVSLWALPSGKLRTGWSHTDTYQTLAAYGAFAVDMPPGANTVAAAGLGRLQSLDTSAGVLPNRSSGAAADLGWLQWLESDQWVFSLVYSPNGLNIATGGTNVNLWDVASGRIVITYTGHQNLVTSVAFSPDGCTLASASWDQTVRLWDVERGSELAVRREHAAPVSSVDFSPDGTVLASGGWDGTIRLWNTANWKPRDVLNLEPDRSIPSHLFGPAFLIWTVAWFLAWKVRRRLAAFARAPSRSRL